MFIDGGVIGRALYGLFKHGNGLFYVAIHIMRPSQRILDRWIIGLQPARFLYERQSLIDLLPTLYLRVAEIIPNHGLIWRQLVGPFQLCPRFVPLSCLFQCSSFEPIQLPGWLLSAQAVGGMLVLVRGREIIPLLSKKPP